MLIAEGLKKTFFTKTGTGLFRKKTAVEAVRGVNLEIREGQIAGLLGINGAGKTTTIKMLSTLLAPTEGKIRVDELDAVRSPMEVKKRINMIAGGERMIYWRLTGRENLLYYGRLYGLDKTTLNRRVDELLEMTGLTERQHVPVEQYSKGMKQRLQIARGLINDPAYLFLDEPTLGLDALIARDLRQHIRTISTQRGKGMLLTSHYIQEIEELCDYVYVLDKGVVVAEGTPEVLAGLGEQRKRVALGFEGAPEGFVQTLAEALRKVHPETCMEPHSSGEGYLVCSPLDVRPVVSALCLEHQVALNHLIRETPSLEDAIIRLSKEAAS